MLWTKQELLQALSSELLEHNLSQNLTIDEVVIDSRKTPKSGLFVALKGEKSDAHQFVLQALTNGCKALLIEDKSALAQVENCDFILVKNTFAALYKLAEFSRMRSKAKIIAITGSVGKTSTKEMLALAFSAYGKTFATIGNLNNHIGLPLCLANFSGDCQFGIFEMGMNHANEIEPLSRLARPHLAVITNVGPVHIENFDDEKEIALAKAEIFLGLEPQGIALINRDNEHFNLIKKRAEFCGVAPKNILTFGKNSESDYCLESFKIKSASQSEVFLLNADKKISYQISSSNQSAIFNSNITAACLQLLTKNCEIGLQQLTKMPQNRGRGQILEIILDNKKITIIDDTYNASVLSMESGLEYVTNLKTSLQKNRIIAALGDMLELGEKSVELHARVANYLRQFKIDFAILVGEKMTESAKKLPQNSYQTFLDSASASLEIKGFLQDGDILYIKGSRGMKMEKIIENLIK
jgi:UDP-N-acetylmuramoyl-tripeptide--D-alanyl-D-alanine ligase